MTEIFDLHSRLTGALHDRAQVWRFLADFAAHWQQPLEPGDGWSRVEVEAAERRLGLVLPGRFVRCICCSGVEPT